MPDEETTSGLLEILGLETMTYKESDGELLISGKRHLISLVNNELIYKL